MSIDSCLLSITKDIQPDTALQGLPILLDDDGTARLSPIDEIKYGRLAGQDIEKLLKLKEEECW